MLKILKSFGIQIPHEFETRYECDPCNDLLQSNFSPFQIVHLPRTSTIDTITYVYLRILICASL